MSRQRFVVAFAAIFLLVAILEVGFLLLKHNNQEKAAGIKYAAVRLIGLPDLALSTEARYIRHRSLSDFHSLFSEEGTLPEYFPSAFTYALPPYQHADTRITGE
jgi:hypothetical protein